MSKHGVCKCGDVDDAHAKDPRTGEPTFCMKRKCPCVQYEEVVKISTSDR